MEETRILATRYATLPEDILLLGPTGSGKGHLARYIHDASRCSGRFLSIAGGQLSESLWESQLFGHLAGAYTDAKSRVRGAFEQAAGGTLFLDELHHWSPSVQSGLLYPLEARRFRPLGAEREVDVTCRLVFATTRSIFLPGGLVGEAQVYASSDANLLTATSPVQSTRTFYDRLGQVDSLIGPGQRSPAKEARKQSFERYSFGRPTYVYGGNGSLVGRMYDDQGRVKAQVQFPMSPSQPLGTEPFADAATTSYYSSLIMNVGPHLSAGQTYNFRYDNDGNVAEETGYDNFLAASPANRTRTYSRVGALVRDQVVYAGGLRVRRAYEYNRRGQRTLAADTVDLTGTGTISGDKLGWTRYVYDNATGRLDSMVVSVDTTGGVLTYGRTKWYFDKGGRDTLQVLILYPSNASSNKFQIKKVYKKASGLDSIYTVTQDSASKKWYEFTSPTYALNDELTAYTATEPGTTGAVTYAFKFAADGTRRLVKSTRTPSAGSTTDTLKYDVFGNRSWELRNSTIFVDPGTCNNKADTLLYGADNRLLSRRKATPCSDFTTYYHDQAGNRIAQRDTLPVSPIVRTQKFTYTAANQLFFTLNATEALGTYNANWHWYDASGMRVMTHAQITNTWNASFAPDSGTRTFYFYDGSDVALSVSRSPTNQYWVGQRYMTGGLDRQLAGRFRAGATSFRQTLALVGDRQGSTVVAVRPGGTQESNTSFVVRGPFGTQEGAVTTGGINTQTGYTGASTPTQSGGFTYLRNRWYDPKTGRFLTQDPIGLAGGVNLYAYAGGNPISFSDPFGLCPMELTGRPCLSPIQGGLRLRTSPGNPDIGRFGMTRTSASGGSVAHHGVDAATPYLTSITAADKGTVVQSGWERVNGEYGRRVIVAHSNAQGKIVSYTSYSHLYATDVEVGDEVDAGQQVGRSGNSGNAEGTTPHLHFEITKVRYPRGGRDGLGDRFDPADHIANIEALSPR